jgi:hypothetical protein
MAVRFCQAFYYLCFSCDCCIVLVLSLNSDDLKSRGKVAGNIKAQWWQSNSKSADEEIAGVLQRGKKHCIDAPRFKLALCNNNQAASLDVAHSCAHDGTTL